MIALFSKSNEIYREEIRFEVCNCRQHWGSVTSILRLQAPEPPVSTGDCPAQPSPESGPSIIYVAMAILWVIYMTYIRNIEFLNFNYVHVSVSAQRGWKRAAASLQLEVQAASCEPPDTVPGSGSCPQQAFLTARPSL